MRDIHIAVLGSDGVGKSCLVLQYLQGHFVEKYDATIEDIYRKQMRVNDRTVMMTIVDTSGQEAFAPMRYHYVKKCRGIVLVYSITDAESFTDVKKSLQWIPRSNGSLLVPCVLVGNKVDESRHRMVSTVEGSNFAKQVKCPFFEVTARDRGSVEQMFTTLVRAIEGEESVPSPKHEATTRLSFTNSETQWSGSILPPAQPMSPTSDAKPTEATPKAPIPPKNKKSKKKSRWRKCSTM
ncbi:ADP ribosylation factor family Ras of Complex Roc domain [Trypanosoma vivax]|nr:putative small GTP-binding protein RAB6 [Trypanosoma vivax]KAH8613030.1 ADP ribosylation factor family Ras of Complex Roc domain [Trypanosoma vivax]